MPKMKGAEALRQIKQLNPNQIVISSSSSDSNYTFETEAKQLGAYSCLYKPVDIDEIMKVIEEASNNNKA